VTDYRDPKLPGFVLRARPTGIHSWRVQLASRRWLTIGRVDEVALSDARETAQTRRAQAALGQDIPTRRPTSDVSLRRGNSDALRRESGGTVKRSLCLLKKDRKPRGSRGTLLYVLQLRAGPLDVARNPCDGGWHCESRLDSCRNRRPSGRTHERLGVPYSVSPLVCYSRVRLCSAANKPES
jgi:hypothetical protein